MLILFDREAIPRYKSYVTKASFSQLCFGLLIEFLVILKVSVRGIWIVQYSAMGVLMGGSGSTGSSLLRTILNRHHEIFSGDELNFLNKEQYFEDWPKYKRRIFTRFRAPLSTKGWFPYPGHSLLREDYQWTADSLGELVETAPSIEDFVDSYFERPLQSNGKKIWIEKTPSNSYSFGHFLRVFPQGKVIHTSRNPLDAVGSLVRSGMSPYFASGLWLYNTASALSVANNPRYLLVRYEDLLGDPVAALKNVLEFIEVEFTPDILEPSRGDSIEHVRNSGWRYDRTGPIARNTNSSFQLLPQILQDEIIGTLSSIRITRKHAISKRLAYSSCLDVCAALGYEFRTDTIVNSKKLSLEYIKDIIYRTWKRYPTNILFYPLEIRLHGEG